MTLAEIVRRWALWAPDRPAVIDRGVPVTYAELDARANRLAHALLAAGCRRGDRLMTVLDNGTSAVETMLAAGKAGMVVVPVNVRSVEQELRQLVELVSPRFAVTEAPTVLTSLVPGVTVSDGAYGNLVGAAPDDDPAVDVPPDEIAAIVFTGGTTGVPKGCAFRHGGLVEHAGHLVRAYDMMSDSRFLQLYPHTSAGAFNVTIAPTLLAGATSVLEDVGGFTADRFFGAVERHRVTHTQMVPTMLVRVLDALDERADLSSLEMVGYGSAPIPRGRIDEMIERLGPIFMQVYGSTEAGGLTHTLDRTAHRLGDPRLDSCGRALPAVDARLLDEEGRPVAQGKIGEIAFRSRYLTAGAWQPDGSLAPVTTDGWLHSGDLGRLDDAEYLHLVDRTKDVVLTGGYTVSSVEVEEALYTHPAVLGAAVVGLPDPEWGEVVHAVVELRTGRHADPDELLAHCRTRLTGFKCPRTVEIRDALPKSPLGKITKPQLRQELTARTAGANPTPD